MSDSNPRMLSGDQKIKLTQLINEGCQIMHEVETLNAGLSETIKAIADEMEVKPTILRKAIRIAHKAEYTKQTQDNELLDMILHATGKTL